MLEKNVFIRRFKMDISNERLEAMIQDIAVELQQILYETLPSDRMDKYLNGTRQEKIDLNYNVPMGYFSDEQQHQFVLEEWKDMMPEKDNQSIEVILKVLFPETLIRLYKEITKKSYEEAEEELSQGKVRCELIKGISCFF